MKLSYTVSILAVAVSAIAEPTLTEREPATLVERDLATVTQVLSTISQQVDSLDTAVKGFSGDISAVQSASSELLSTIKSGTSKVAGTSPLTLNEATTVAGSVTGLNSSVATVVSDLISKKSAIVAAGQGGAILQSLQDQKSASQALADAITSKVPTELQAVATQLSSGIASSLQSGIDAFQGTGGGPSSSSSAGGSSSSSAGPSSSSSAAAPPSSSSSAATTSAKTSSSAVGGATPSKPVVSGTGSNPSKTSSTAPFTGAAVANSFNGPVGALAAVAAVLAL